MLVMREVEAGPTSDRPALRQVSFNWNAPDMHVELMYFKVEIANILLTKSYKLND